MKRTKLIPSKVFLLGEYAALCGYPAILLTAPPYFEVQSLKSQELVGIHPDSPAARFWKKHGKTGLQFKDPHQGLGGMGASSAQFLAVYQQYCEERGQTFSIPELLDAYWSFAWNKKGVKPSGYDLLAQTREGLSYVQADGQVEALTWPFDNLALSFIHTRQKWVTHTHLQGLQAMPDVSILHQLTQQGYQALQDSQLIFVDIINHYYEAMLSFGWVAPHTCEWIDRLRKEKGVLALKGCGAMGSDVIVALVEKGCLRNFDVETINYPDIMMV